MIGVGRLGKRYDTVQIVVSMTMMLMMMKLAVRIRKGSNFCTKKVQNFIFFVLFILFLFRGVGNYFKYSIIIHI